MGSPDADLSDDDDAADAGSSAGPAPATARDRLGDIDPFLFLAGDEVVVPGTPEEVWELVEADHQVTLLTVLSDRFDHREILETFPDGYRCRTTAKVRLGRRSSFESVIALEPGRRSFERQVGTRTEVLYELDYQPHASGTRVTCAQSYLARTSSFESGAAISQMQRQAATVVADRVAAIGRLVSLRSG